MGVKRNETIDVIKGYGICLMVCGHSSFPFTDWIYLFVIRRKNSIWILGLHFFSFKIVSYVIVKITCGDKLQLEPFVNHQVVGEMNQSTAS